MLPVSKPSSCKTPALHERRAQDPPKKVSKTLPTNPLKLVDRSRMPKSENLTAKRPCACCKIAAVWQCPTCQTKLEGEYGWVLPARLRLEKATKTLEAHCLLRNAHSHARCVLLVRQNYHHTIVMNAIPSIQCQTAAVSTTKGFAGQ